MKKVKLWIFSSITILAPTIVLISCSIPSTKDDKINPDDKNEDNDFLSKPIDEAWKNIDVDVKTLNEWLQVKNLYEKAIIKLNTQNEKLLENSDDNHDYYKNLFYIAWYLRIIGKANQNISWLKFESLYGHILESEDKDANFSYLLYIQHRLPDSMYFTLHNYFFKNLVKYRQGDLLENNVYIPKNYLNLTKDIDSQSLNVYYRSFMKWEDRENIWKVLKYFKDEKDTVKFQINIDANNAALKPRWENRIWNPSQQVSKDYAYNRWLATLTINNGENSKYDFHQLRWEEWINH